VTALALPKAFVVQWSQMDRWSVDSFRTIGWRWPAAVMRPLGEALKLRRDEVDRDLPKDEVPIIEKISFGGVITVTDADARRGYKGRLFWASPGELVYSKIRVKQGSLAVVPSEIEVLAVSTEYPVYRIEPTIADGRYIELVVRSEPFKQLLDGLSHGGSTKTRIPPDEFARLVVPLPPLQTQRAIVAAFDRSRDEVARLRAEADKLEADAEADFLKALGLKPPAQTAPPKVFAMPWSAMKRWGVQPNQMAATGVDLTVGAFPAVELRHCLAGTANGYSIKPVSQKTPHKMLRLSALQPGYVDTEDSKYVRVTERIAKRFHIRKGDLLICRSIGSFDQVAKCSLVREDRTDILFPDIMIRAQFNNTVDPRYAREVIQSKPGRRWFQQAARTAVGMWKIGGADIASFPIPLPDRKTQESLVEKVVAGRSRAADFRSKAQEAEQSASDQVEAMILGTRPIPK